ncbi:hypothetical protein DFH06DRAFT_1292955 [Mycena polygramma]|nr:hypothetical protein DFH06DRAFT_1292955 [Mycena polygramma]
MKIVQQQDYLEIRQRIEELEMTNDNLTMEKDELTYQMDSMEERMSDLAEIIAQCNSSKGPRDNVLKGWGGLIGFDYYEGADSDSVQRNYDKIPQMGEDPNYIKNRRARRKEQKLEERVRVQPKKLDGDWDFFLNVSYQSTDGSDDGGVLDPDTDSYNDLDSGVLELHRLAVALDRKERTKSKKAVGGSPEFRTARLRVY